MIVIVEGPDGAGKTTFAQSIVGADYRHEGPPPTDLGPGNLLAYYLDKVVRVAHSPRPVVFDRLALGEVVYGPILRGVSRLTTEDLRAYLITTRRLGAVHVLCLPPYQVCLNNWSSRVYVGRELFADRGLFDKTYAAFDDLRDAADVVVDYTAGGKR